MSGHKTPTPGYGYEDLTHQLPKQEPPRGTLSFAVYGLMSGWKSVVVAVALEDHGNGALMHHLSVSRSLLGVQQRIGKFPADVQHALEAFGMQEAEENNRASNGYAHHFWLRAGQ